MNKSFELFVCQRGGREGTELLDRALIAYGVDRGELAEAALCRADMGKPYFKGLDINFNISHSRDVWACLIGPACCGLDVQYIKPCNFEKIAGRFFSYNDKKYSEAGGLEGFFDIWVRREAFGKYTGEGFFGDFGSFADDEGNLIETMAGAEFKVIHIAPDCKCVCCVPQGSARDFPIKIREDF